MWGAWVVAAVAVAGAAFMLRFLIALLGEGAPSVCFWVVPIGSEPQREVFEALSANYVEDDCRARECNSREYDVEFLENDNYAKEKCSSGLIALDVRPVSGGLGRRSIHSKRGYGFSEHRL
jgi:hypothetical protein